MLRQAADDLEGGQWSPREIKGRSGLGIGPDISISFHLESGSRQAYKNHRIDLLDRGGQARPDRHESLPDPRPPWPVRGHDAAASMTTFWDLAHRPALPTLPTGGSLPRPVGEYAAAAGRSNQAGPEPEPGRPASAHIAACGAPSRRIDYEPRSMPGCNSTFSWHSGSVLVLRQNAATLWPAIP